MQSVQPSNWISFPSSHYSLRSLIPSPQTGVVGQFVPEHGFVQVDLEYW